MPSHSSPCSVGATGWSKRGRDLLPGQCPLPGSVHESASGYAATRIGLINNGVASLTPVAERLSLFGIAIATARRQAGNRPDTFQHGRRIRLTCAEKGGGFVLKVCGHCIFPV